GDVENGATFDAWNAARTRLEDLFDLTPAALACDLHPSYLSSQWAREQAREQGLPLIEVQHHHAHIASVMAEAIAAGRLVPNTRVLGIAFDGTGAGTDGTIWGGEFLVAGLADFERAAHLRTWALPGGAASVRDARRNAFSLLSELGLLEHPGATPLLDSIDEQTRSVTTTMIERSINSPRTSSMGRLFDAAAAILGICGQATYEGEPAIELEAAAWRALDGENASSTDSQAGASTPADGSPILDPQPLFEALLEGIEAGTPADKLALGFHIAIARASARIASEICAREGIDTVALSGGVFMNRLLLRLLACELKDAGLAVLVPHTVPVNDGCISYGQAAVARARLAQVIPQ
ncbi:Kae1-like domain-containing protein, partial [Collinsella aerofaciens]